MTDPRWGFRQVIVINRTCRHDRLATLRAHWNATQLAWMPLSVLAAVEGPDPAVACLDSHLAALETAAGPVLILEDDAVFGPTFPWDAPPPPDWATLWLGAEHVALPRPATQGWVQPVEILRTHAYVAREPAELAAKSRARRLPRADPYLARLGLPAYVADPQTVGQAAGRSDTGGPARSRVQFWHL